MEHLSIHGIERTQFLSHVDARNNMLYGCICPGDVTCYWSKFPYDACPIDVLVTSHIRRVTVVAAHKTHVVSSVHILYQCPVDATYSRSKYPHATSDKHPGDAMFSHNRRPHGNCCMDNLVLSQIDQVTDAHLSVSQCVL